MVNANRSGTGSRETTLRSSLLRMLREADGILSGQCMADRLGVSRVAVWKQVRTLREQGYRIEADRTGYRLIDGNDLLLPDDFAQRSERLLLFRRVATTMDIARKTAETFGGEETAGYRQEAEAAVSPKRGENLLIVADEQDRGRGRRGRSWLSPRGGLYMTYLVRPHAALADSWMYQAVAAVSLARALSDRFALQARLKWPNDLLIDGRKVAGILTESRGEGGELRWIALGVGVNVNSRVPLDGVSSLSEILGRDVSRKDLIEAWLSAMDSRLPRLPRVSPLTEWAALCCTLGHRVTVRDGVSAIRGLAEGIGPNGSLILREDSGAVRSVSVGDCLHE